MRFSISGLIQYFTELPIPSCRCTIVTRAPWRHSSSAAMAAEFFPPTIKTSSPERMWLAVIMQDFRQVLARDVHQVWTIIISSGQNQLARPVRTVAAVQVGGVHD